MTVGGFGMMMNRTGHAGGSQRRQQPGWPRLPQQLRPVRSLRQLLATTSVATRCQGSPVLRWLATKSAALGRGGRWWPSGLGSSILHISLICVNQRSPQIGLICRDIPPGTVALLVILSCNDTAASQMVMACSRKIVARCSNSWI